MTVHNLELEQTFRIEPGQVLEVNMGDLRYIDYIPHGEYDEERLESEIVFFSQLPSGYPLVPMRARTSTL